MDSKNIRNVEKLLKVVQYSSRVLNSMLKKKWLRRLYSALSLSRRTTRALKHFNVVRTIISFFLRNWSNRSKRGFKLVYYCCLYVFMLCDIAILLFKFKIFKNRKILLKIFDFVDWVWIVQNSLGILDVLVETCRIKNERREILAEIDTVLPHVQADNDQTETESAKKEQDLTGNPQNGQVCSPKARIHESGQNTIEKVNMESTDSEDDPKKKRLIELVHEKSKLESQLVVQSKYCIKLLAEIFLAFGFLYPKQVGEVVLSFSGTISAISVY